MLAEFEEVALFHGKNFFFHRISTFNGRFLYGIIERSCRQYKLYDLCVVLDQLPSWCNILHPLGPESALEFWARMRGMFKRADVQPFEGHSVTEIL